MTANGADPEQSGEPTKSPRRSRSAPSPRLDMFASHEHGLCQIQTSTTSKDLFVSSHLHHRRATILEIRVWCCRPAKDRIVTKTLGWRRHNARKQGCPSSRAAFRSRRESQIADGLHHHRDPLGLHTTPEQSKIQRLRTRRRVIFRGRQSSGSVTARLLRWRLGRACLSTIAHLRVACVATTRGC